MIEPPNLTRAKAMTEAEWLAATSPAQMLEFLRGRSTDRKLRQFALACCRAAWALIPEGLHRESLCLAERHADGLVTDTDLGVVVSSLHRARRKRNQIDRAVYEAVRYRRDQGFGSAESVADAIARSIALILQSGRPMILAPRPSGAPSARRLPTRGGSRQ